MNKLTIRFIRYSCICGLFFTLVSCINVDVPQSSATIATQTGTAASSIPSLSPMAAPTNTISSLPTDSPIASSTPIPSLTPTTLPSDLTPTKTLTSVSPTDANQIRVMLIDQNGDLWTGGPGGVVRWDVDTNEYVIYTTADGLASNEVVAITQTPDGVLWFGTFGAGISRFNGENWQSYTTQDGLPGNFIASLFVMPNGTLGVDTLTSPYPADPDWEGYLGQFDGQTWTPLGGGGFDRVITAPDGTFWASSYRLGLWHFDEGELDDWFPVENNTALAVALDNIVWVATTTNVYSINGSSLRKLNPPWMGQTDTSIATIAISSDGVVWFGFSSIAPDALKCGFRSPSIDEWGTYRYDGNTWSHITVDDGLVDNKICAIVIGIDESVWFGSFDKGVSRFDGNTWTTYIIPEQSGP